MADLSGLSQAILERGAEIAQQAAEITKNDTRDAAPVASGETRDSVDVALVEAGEVVRYEIEATTPQALWTDEGSPGGQLIVPVSKKALFWDGADHPVRSVIRGTIPAQHWFGEPMQARWSAACEEAAS